MAERMWIWIGGLAISLGLGALLGWLAGGLGLALLGGAVPTLAALALVVVETGRHRTMLGTLTVVLSAIEAGRSVSGDALPRELAQPLSRLATSARTTQGFFRGITDGLPIPFLLVDTDERTLYTNAATMRMLEIDAPPESQLGRTLAEVFYNDSGRQTVVGRAMREDLIFSNKEVTIIGHKGGRRDVFYNVFPLKDAAGTIIGGLCLYLDVTELRAKDEALCRHSERTTAQAAKAGTLAGDLAATARTLASRVAQASQAARDQRTRLERVATAMERLGHAAGAIAGKAEETEGVADQTRQQAAGAADTMARVLAGMDQLSRKATALGGHMETLSKQARQVGGILGVISDIADQTNLLALNAAIEAARAGESGRGFAVVADEVRKLAEKTMAATSEVAHNVTAIRDSAETNNRVTGEAVALVTQTAAIAGEAGTALGAILDLAGRTSTHVRAIAEAASSQTSAGDEAVRHGGEIAAAAADTSQAMDESARAVDALARVTADLEALFAEGDAAG